MYKKTQSGLIRDFTGVQSPYEPPKKHDVTVNIGESSVEVSEEQVL